MQKRQRVYLVRTWAAPQIDVEICQRMLGKSYAGPFPESVSAQVNGDDHPERIGVS